jgi:hypothetical protein
MHEINGVPGAELFQEIGSMENVLSGFTFLGYSRLPGILEVQRRTM